jgi:hypothetical protein
MKKRISFFNYHLVHKFLDTVRLLVSSSLVSADVLLLLIFNLDPGERGLEEQWDDGYWKNISVPG